LSPCSSSGEATWMLTGGCGRLTSSSSSANVGLTRTEVARLTRWHKFRQIIRFQKIFFFIFCSKRFCRALNLLSQYQKKGKKFLKSCQQMSASLELRSLAWHGGKIYIKKSDLCTYDKWYFKLKISSIFHCDRLTNIWIIWYSITILTHNSLFHL
jgi:hypothetical protein